MADVLIQMPGASAAEVENLVTINLEKKLWADRRRRARVLDLAARLRAGDRALLRRRRSHRQPGQDLQQDPIEHRRGAVRRDRLGGETRRDQRRADPEPDALYSATASDADLRRVGDEILQPPAASPEHRGLHRGRRAPAPDPRAARPRAHGGARRRTAGSSCASCAAPTPTCAPESSRARIASSWSTAGRSSKARRSWAAWSLAAPAGKPVSVRDVAEVIDGPEETTTYTRLALRPGGRTSARPGRRRDSSGKTSFPAVTIGLRETARHQRGARRRGPLAQDRRAQA